MEPHSEADLILVGESFDDDDDDDNYWWENPTSWGIPTHNISHPNIGHKDSVSPPGSLKDVQWF